MKGSLVTEKCCILRALGECLRPGYEDITGIP